MCNWVCGESRSGTDAFRRRESEAQVKATNIIQSLTPEQVARFPEFVEEWIRIGLSTEPVDRRKADAAIRQVYQCGGVAPPARIVWCGSPLSQGLTRHFVRDLAKRASELKIGDSVRDSVGATAWHRVRASAGASVGARVRASVRDSVWDSVRASVWASVGASVGDSVRASV